MGAVILGPQSKLPARSLIVAPRLPSAAKRETYKTPFDADGDVVADCDVAGCTYHVMGPRRWVGEAMREHHRMYHPDKIGVVLLNQPRQ